MASVSLMVDILNLRSGQVFSRISSLFLFRKKVTDGMVFVRITNLQPIFESHERAAGVHNNNCLQRGEVH